jgi:hypothetical protein
MVVRIGRIQTSLTLFSMSGKNVQVRSGMLSMEWYNLKFESELHCVVVTKTCQSTSEYPEMSVEIASDG